MEQSSDPMEFTCKVNSKMERPMEKEFKYIQMDQYMKVILLMTNSKEKDNSSINSMAWNTTVNGKKTDQREKGNKPSLELDNTKENSSMEENTERDKWNGLIRENTKETSHKGSCMVMECSRRNTAISKENSTRTAKSVELWGQKRDNMMVPLLMEKWVVMALSSGEMVKSTKGNSSTINYMAEESWLLMEANV